MMVRIGPSSTRDSMRVERQCAAQMIQLRPELLPVSRMPHDEPLLGAIAFGGDASVSLCGKISQIVLPLPELGAPQVEVWRAVSPIDSGTDDGIVFARGGGALFRAMLARDRDIESTTRDAYTRVIAFVRRAGTPHLLPILNPVRDTNSIHDPLKPFRPFSTP